MKFKEKFDVAPEFESLLEFKSKKAEFDHEAQMLMFKFLSEIDKYRQIQGVSKKALAAGVGTSQAYITQLFNGNTKLNFNVLAKMQHALNINFSIQAHADNSCMDIVEQSFLDILSSYKTNTGAWYYKNFKKVASHKDVYNNSADTEIKILSEYESTAIPA